MPNKIMKAEPPVVPLQLKRLPAYVSIKLDGWRCSIQGGRVWTSSLKPFPNKHIAASLSAYEGLDGEVIVGDPAAPDCFNKTDAACKKFGGEPEFTFYVFDWIRSGPYEERLRMLQNEILPDFIKVLPQIPVYTLEELATFYEQAIAAGHEGVMTRTLDSPYKHGRATASQEWLLKHKPYEDSEFAIEGFFEAMENTNEAFVGSDGRTARTLHQSGMVPKGMLGGFNGRDLHTGSRFNVACGKLTHAERKHIWENQSMYASKIGVYRKFPIGEIDKPRHGRWIKWRSPEEL